MPFTISPRAYGKMLLHCCKYPDKAVNGVVVGAVSKKDQSVQIQDAIPLFHLGLGLAPMMEVALTQVELYCSMKGLSIVGYYHANERVEDSSPTEAAFCVAQKISSNCDKTCLLMIENGKIMQEEDLALRLYTHVESPSHWKEQSAHRDLTLIGGEHIKRCTRKLMQNRLSEQLVDFDNHLDNPQLDWTNPNLNRAIESADD